MPATTDYKSNEKDNNDKRSSKNDAKAHASKKRRRVPPNVTSDDDWVQQWINGPQRDDDNRYMFCSFGKHDSKQCYYLVPEKRPTSWKPFKDLWCYKTPKELPLQSKLASAAEGSSQDSTFSMERTPGYMTIRIGNVAETDQHEHGPPSFNPDEFPSLLPWIADTATSFLCVQNCRL